MSEFKQLIDLIHSIDDKVLLEDFMFAVTTPSERVAFSQRLEIVKKLIAGEPQAKIAKDLGVGIATVTRGSKELSEGKFKVLRPRT